MRQLTFSMSNPFTGTGNAGGRPGVNSAHSLVTPYTEEYNLTLEHQFPHGMDVRVGYVGQHNLKQNNSSGSGTYAPNLNYADPFDITKSAAAQAPFPVLGTIGYQVAPLFHSQMNSMQIGAHKQYNHGLAFGVEYQWTRVLGTENLEDPSGKYPQDSYGNIAGITPDVLQLSYSYALPFGKGRSLFANAGPVANNVIGGWELAGVVDAQSGQPFSVSYTAPTNVYPGAVSGRANQVPGISLYPSNKTKAQWFNPAAFTAPLDSLGRAGGIYGKSGYDMLYGPRYQSWDMNLKKNIAWGDHYNVQLPCRLLQHLQPSKLQHSEREHLELKRRHCYCAFRYAELRSAHHRVRSEVQLLTKTPALSLIRAVATRQNRKPVLAGGHARMGLSISGECQLRAVFTRVLESRTFV